MHYRDAGDGSEREIRRELDVLNKQRSDDQRRINWWTMPPWQNRVKAPGAPSVTATVGLYTSDAYLLPGGSEPQPETPRGLPAAGSVAVPPPRRLSREWCAPPRVTYQSYRCLTDTA